MNKRTALSAVALLALATTFASTPFAADSKAAIPAASAASAASAAAPAAAPAHEITKEQAVDMATKAHPGQVTKAYEDTKKGKKTWEVKISGTDGKKWEVHYEIKTGALVSEEGK
ncbi:Propeptide PepSY amd peptidase M4 [Candidatus Accumulibacter aalborgensis]|uniref:Propeptide PepSY amd peptidase M4 n=1 Tax=Candidatus Accumulibacter aalborgensis TaxID=1860102 RepID=A0A1A8XWC2_9PROT|nr:PepSY domain-containing protein [Candidatus Accumulibacter aalborgensis]SBT09309.1 Propeptide PepSY amd peptidase M4 [Candidatus Accumulibacter aalborgensis]